jgi:hypothetical protein
VHPKAPFGQKILLYPYYSMDILLAKVVFGAERFLQMAGTSPRKLLLGRPCPKPCWERVGQDATFPSDARLFAGEIFLFKFD